MEISVHIHQCNCLCGVQEAPDSHYLEAAHDDERSLLIWGEDSEEDGGWWWGDHLYPGSLSLTHFTVPTRAFSFFINKNLLTIKTLDADVYLLQLLQLLLETILYFIIFKNKE